jgi:hypothetical protein
MGKETFGFVRYKVLTDLILKVKNKSNFSIFFFLWLSSNEPAVNHRILEAEKSTDWGELNVREP